MPTEAEEAADAIIRLLADQSVPAHQRIKSGTLRVFGDWFGRPHDNIHVIVAAEADADVLTVRFNEDERLTVWRPRGAVVNRAEFRIRSADRVTWEWFNYGRPKAPENLYTEEHWLEDGAVRATSNADWYTKRFDPSTADAAAELL